MPIVECSLPEGGSGYRWGASGKCFRTRQEAFAQAEAAHANGYIGDEAWDEAQAAYDATFNESDHPRGAGGKFGSGSGGGKFTNTKSRVSEADFNKSRANEHSEEIKKLTAHHQHFKDTKSWVAALPAGLKVEHFSDGSSHAYKANGDLAGRFDPSLGMGYVDLPKGKKNESSFAQPSKSETKPLHEQFNAARKKEDKGGTSKDHALDHLAFDKASVRQFDQDGRLRVESANISKANVCPYVGEEIAGWEELGLDPKRVYKLLRDPAELEKAAATFNNLPILDQHTPVNAEDHPADKVVGATGSDAKFVAPYLTNSLIIWTRDAIDGIESGEQRELSCGYRYRAEMTPGVHGGEPYDGIMRDIAGNHVALVAAGRAGPDVIVGDSFNPLTLTTEQGTGMTKPKALSRKAALARGALMAALPAMLAQDAKPDYSALVGNITSKNWKESKPILIAALKPHLKAGLAQDAGVGALGKLLDSLDAVEDKDGIGDDPAPEKKMPAAVDADPAEEIVAMLQGKLSPEDIATISEKLAAMKAAPAAVDAVPAEEDPNKAKDDPNKAKDEEEKVTKTAMDAALKAASIDADKRIKLAVDAAEKSAMERQRAIEEAREVTHPFAGKLSGAFDSAEGVYRAALDVLGVAHKDLHPTALRPVLEASAKASSHTSSRMAADARPEGFAERFPGAGNVRVLG